MNERQMPEVDDCGFPKNPLGFKKVADKIDGSAWVNEKTGLCVIASVSIEQDGHAWLHVSYSYRSRIPSYRDGKAVKAIFIGNDREAYAVYPKSEDHVNIHPYVLQLWARVDGQKALPDFTRGGGSI